MIYPRSCFFLQLSNRLGFSLSGGSGPSYSWVKLIDRLAQLRLHQLRCVFLIRPVTFFH